MGKIVPQSYKRKLRYRLKELVHLTRLLSREAGLNGSIPPELGRQAVHFCAVLCKYSFNIVSHSASFLYSAFESLPSCACLSCRVCLLGRLFMRASTMSVFHIFIPASI